MARKQKCSICNEIPTPNCDYRQGRCPHLPPILNLDPMKHPDPKLHLRISLVKSLIRIACGVALISAGAGTLITAAGVLLILAEALGIVEELV